MNQGIGSVHHRWCGCQTGQLRHVSVSCGFRFGNLGLEMD